MDIANSANVSAAVSNASNGAPGTVQGAASTLVLRKALDVQATSAIALLNALPQQPALATQGSVGRNVNTFA
ncbi:putative motility protein [Roseateles saccharophilus]|uniref:Putative motility protein YjfB-like n=1 Tax=Roseateles saccharophilus TaxID=304 RepID=A0A4R3ULP7_ROSSA|nr:putative motility protein [Roseateles saccharophilus]MDG0833777.1 putative motility protein [Roseateles saccharophilus]TCU91597.1 putative motility protein YjfB-like [Roseateles saccharophilus]